MAYRTTPSYVSFTDSRLIGDAVNNRVTMNPANTVFGTFLISDKLSLNCYILIENCIWLSVWYAVSMILLDPSSKLNTKERLSPTQKKFSMVLVKMEIAEAYPGKVIMSNVLTLN